MSIAITNTRTRIGQRTLGVYHSLNIYRGPAEPGPRSADTIAHRLGSLPLQKSDMLPAFEGPPNRIISVAPPQLEIPTGIFGPNPNGTASQAPTGVAITQNSPVNPQAVAHVTSPTQIPSSVATMAPQGNPGYVVISTGGGGVANAAPDYVAEVKDWLTEESLISGIPNWGVALAAAALLGFVWKESRGR